LRRNAELFGEKPAIVFGRESASWADLWQRTEKAAAVLAERLPNQHQEVVALLAPNSIDYVISYLAIVHAGHIAMPLDITFKKLEIDPIISGIKPALIISDKNLAGLKGSENLPTDKLLSATAKQVIKPLRLPAGEQIATLFLSSGTTGRPKTIPNTHANILWDVRAISAPMKWTEKDTLLLTLNLAHRHGLVICLVGALFHGNTVYLEGRFDPRTTLEKLASGKISIFSAVPSIYESLVNFEPDTDFNLEPVRLFASSSSALPPHLRQTFKKRFGRQILDRYGTSETGSIAIRRPAEENAFGDLLEGVEVRLDSGGKVAIKSPGVFPGYYLNPEATQQNMTKDGWWLTGDIGEMRAGKLVLKGRSTERILKSGYSIYPQDIEWALAQTAGVDEVRVVGLHSPAHVDDQVVAFYSGSTSRETLFLYSKTNLPRSWRPDEFIKLDKLPRTSNGKPKISELKRLAEAKLNG
jgi:acyl-CoA synthetase (AMP-forming)/AMP-acid ligase II